MYYLPAYLSKFGYWFLSVLVHILIALSFRIVVAIFVSLVARLLNSIGGHIFCYSAISSSGVVLILPGFLVCKYSDLDLHSKIILMLN